MISGTIRNLKDSPLEILTANFVNETIPKKLNKIYLNFSLEFLIQSESMHPNTK